MTYEEAIALRQYTHSCTCGGNSLRTERGRSRHPHMDWCPQMPQWEERQAAIERGPDVRPDFTLT